MSIWEMDAIGKTARIEIYNEVIEIESSVAI
jgi:hypothetical protein